MRPIAVCLACAGALGALVGCSLLDPRSYAALDYRIDRTRVLAVRVVMPDDPTTGGALAIDALAMGPLGTPVEETSVQICDEGLERLVRYLPFACFSEPEMVRDLGDAVPLSWMLPDVSGLPCDPPPEETVDTGGYPVTVAWCGTNVPLRVGARAGDDWGYGGVQLALTLVEQVIPEWPWDTGTTTEPPPDPAVVRAEEAWATIDPSAVPGTFEVVGAPEGRVQAGDEVEIRFTSTAPPTEYAWYVDAGDLLRTGRTIAHEETEAGWVTWNTLRVPEGHAGPLRAAVVLGSRTARIEGALWATTTLEVAP